MIRIQLPSGDTRWTHVCESLVIKEKPDHGVIITSKSSGPMPRRVVTVEIAFDRDTKMTFQANSIEDAEKGVMDFINYVEKYNELNK